MDRRVLGPCHFIPSNDPRVLCVNQKRSFILPILGCSRALDIYLVTVLKEPTAGSYVQLNSSY